jgi:aminoglycoside 6'-N-acetyltransferase
MNGLRRRFPDLPAESAVEIRAMTRADLPLLYDWLRRPHVAEWWREVPPDFATVEREYGPCIDGDDQTELFVIESQGRAVGMIQRYLIEDEPDWRSVLTSVAEVDNAAGIDYLIGEPDAVGRGIGSTAIAQFAAMVFDWRPVDSIVVTVQQANTASWRSLEKAGFQRIWSGELDSPDPSDQGPEYAYRLRRP